jgi:hypothetical protein
MLLADVQRAVQGSSDVILFNIDAKADSKDDRDVILQVFLRVFNEKLGYSGDAPHVAEMERHLVSKGAYETFKAAFASRTAAPGMPNATPSTSCATMSCMPWPGRSSRARSPPPQVVRQRARDLPHQHRRLARLIRDYLDTKPAGHRIVFLVDEVGQFIGNNTQLMLTCRPSPSNWARCARAGRGSSSPARKTSTPPSAKPTRPGRRTSPRFRGASTPVCRWPVPTPTR